MIDEMQETIDNQKKSLLDKDKYIHEQKQSHEAELREKERLYQEALKHIAELEAKQKP